MEGRTTTQHQDANSKITRPASEPDLDLYSIPSHSSWFSWDDIHENERVALKEFFDGTSITRTPKIYKEYRDFIINKYREDPSRRVTFSEVRKSLVGDVSLLHKVFLFLEKWGLINFSVDTGSNDTAVDGENKHKVKIEEGAPVGIRVAATPNSLRPISLPHYFGCKREERGENGVKFPPLTSYSDVFGDLVKPNTLACGNCGERCDSGHYEYTKGNFVFCIKCFKNGDYGENKSADDFKFRDAVGNNGASGAFWTEEETFLLLDSVLKHGDDWELVAQNVPTKNKLDCISKLIELPFGELIMGSASRRDNSTGTSENHDNAKHVEPSSDLEEQIEMEGQDHEQTKEREENGDSVDQEPPLKRTRTASVSDTGSSLMKQVALTASIVDPPVAAAAAEAAIAALCDETSCPREIYEDDDDEVTNGYLSPILLHGPDGAQPDEDSERKERPADAEAHEASPTNDLPLAIRLRASVATALGAAAAHAKLLADQEEREMENVVATIIEAQLEKLHSKINHFDDLELIMEKEHTAMEELKEHILAERIGLLQSAFRAGITKRWDHTYVKTQN